MALKEKLLEDKLREIISSPKTYDLVASVCSVIQAHHIEIIKKLKEEENKMNPYGQQGFGKLGYKKCISDIERLLK